MINNIRTDMSLLSINYVLYTDGDQEFKRELISLMITNLKELKWSVSSNYDDFKKVTHKVKSTLKIIDCARLNELVHEFDQNPVVLEHEPAKIRFNNLCEDIIGNLEVDASGSPYDH